MTAIYDFLNAALPWIEIGLFLAIYFVISEKKKKSEEKYEDYGAVGLCLGMAAGSGLALARGAGGNVHVNGMMLGMMLGFLIGSCIKKVPKQDETKEK